MSEVGNARKCKEQSSIEDVKENLKIFEEELLAAGIKYKTMMDHKKFILHVMNLLIKSGRSIQFCDFSIQTVEWLYSRMNNIQPRTADRYVRSFGMFVLFFTGKNPYVEYRKSNEVHEDPLNRFTKGKHFQKELEMFRDYKRQHGIHEITIKGQLKDINACISKIDKLKGFGYSLTDVTVDDIYDLRESFGELKESTVKKYLISFGLFIKFCTGHNPYPDAILLWNDSTEERRLFIFKDDWKLLMDAADPKERVVLVLGAALGLRRAEIANIKLSDINDDKITVRGKGHGPCGKLAILDMPKGVIQTILEYLPFRELEIKKYGDYSEDNLLVRSTVRGVVPFTPDNVGDLIYALSNRTRIQVTPHSLRRLYAITMREAGVDLDTLRRMMRHADAYTTTRCYLNADPRLMGKAKDAVNSALFE